MGYIQSYSTIQQDGVLISVVVPEFNRTGYQRESHSGIVTARIQAHLGDNDGENYTIKCKWERACCEATGTSRGGRKEISTIERGSKTSSTTSMCACKWGNRRAGNEAAPICFSSCHSFSIFQILPPRMAPQPRHPHRQRGCYRCWEATLSLW